MNESRILEACFELAKNLMGEKELSAEDVHAHMSELSEMTDTFIEIVKKQYYYVKNNPAADDIMVGAINFIGNQAIPPLRGNYEWFGHSLAMVLEICYPVCGPGKSDIPFLLEMQTGITHSIRTALNNDNDLHNFRH